jgi:hypothetical protein
MTTLTLEPQASLSCLVLVQNLFGGLGTVKKGFHFPEDGKTDNLLYSVVPK